jgi:hypothetical protein
MKIGTTAIAVFSSLTAEPAARPIEFPFKDYIRQIR